MAPIFEWNLERFDAGWGFDDLSLATEIRNVARTQLVDFPVTYRLPDCRKLCQTLSLAIQGSPAAETRATTLWKIKGLKLTGVDAGCREPSSVIYPKPLLKMIVFADRSAPMTRLRAVSALASVTILSLALPTLTFADSQIRMVRLSQVDGTVQIDRNSGNGFEKAIPNMPITQGVRLQTGSNGRAEVEMEDGTTIRLAPDTAMSFPELVLHDSGIRASTAQLTLGTAYFNVLHKKKEEIRVAFAHQSIDVDHEVRFRVSVDLATAKVSVFKGELKIPNAR